MEVVCYMAILLIMYSLVASYCAQAANRGRTATCASNLKQIGMALRTYALDYGGAMPPAEGGLARLDDRYAADTAVLLCPEVEHWCKLNPGEVPPSRVGGPTQPPLDYAYRPELFSDDLPFLAVASDFSTDQHRDHMNVLYLDGRVERLKWSGEAGDARPLLEAGALDGDAGKGGANR